MTLLDIIKEASEGFDGKLGVSVKHLSTGESASLNGDEIFPSGSVRKVSVIVELYRQVEAKRIDLDEKVVIGDAEKFYGGILMELSSGLTITLRDLVALMMILSDNTATPQVIKRVGQENINTTLTHLGLEKTKLVASARNLLFDWIGLDYLPDEEKTLELYVEKARTTPFKGSWSIGVEKNNVTTPNEMLRLMEMIVDGEAASRESCDAILDLMSRCQTGRDRISKYLPRLKVTVAHKTGSSPGIRNDVGVVTIHDTGERYILSCFARDAANNLAAVETLARVSKNVYDYFTTQK